MALPLKGLTQIKNLHLLDLLSFNYINIPVIAPIKIYNVSSV